ncbi:MAG TPA: hypothetical protein VKX49_28400 [Bryobacteraceae bacterium]|nr:hypothetical protein [Bryobacteraceae bacterium]
MKVRPALLALSISAMLAAALSAQSISVVNINNAAISPSAVVGDVYQVTISGAAANSLVQLNYTQNGNPGTWNAGYTDNSGNWSNTSAPKDASFIGTWTEQWNVGGTNIGPVYSFEVFDKPTSATRSVSSSSPDSCGSTYPPSVGKPYGPSASVQYQIVGSTGNSETVPNTGLGIMLEPEESVGGGSYGDIGCTGSGCPSGFLWSPPSAKYASSTGLFYDIPFAYCANVPYSNVALPSVTIAIFIGNNSYAVASYTESASSSAPGHGSFSGTFSYSQ